jgi:hypothetical protein
VEEWGEVGREFLELGDRYDPENLEAMNSWLGGHQRKHFSVEGDLFLARFEMEVNSGQKLVPAQETNELSMWMGPNGKSFPVVARNAAAGLTVRNSWVQ